MSPQEQRVWGCYLAVAAGWTLLSMVYLGCRWWVSA